MSDQVTQAPNNHPPPGAVPHPYRPGHWVGQCLIASWNRLDGSVPTARDYDEPEKYNYDCNVDTQRKWLRWCEEFGDHTFTHRESFTPKEESRLEAAAQDARTEPDGVAIVERVWLSIVDARKALLVRWRAAEADRQKTSADLARLRKARPKCLCGLREGHPGQHLNDRSAEAQAACREYSSWVTQAHIERNP